MEKRKQNPLTSLLHLVALRIMVIASAHPIAGRILELLRLLSGLRFFCDCMCTITIYMLHIVWIYLPSNLAASTSVPIFLIASLAIYIHILKPVCKCCKCSTWDSFSNFWCQMCTAFCCEVTRAHSCALHAIDS